MRYADILLYVGGKWRSGRGAPLDVMNPATGKRLARFNGANAEDLLLAIQSAGTGFGTWSSMSALDRSGVLRRTASLLRERKESIAQTLTLDEGKPLIEAIAEVSSSADLLDWFAEEGRRAYGRIIPARVSEVRQYAFRSPVGIAVGFTPWNFPVSQIARKLGPALAAGCAIIVKGPEEAPGAAAALFQCLHDAGLPPGAGNLVFGVPAEISAFMISHPAIAKLSFTGSVHVGKQLAAMAGSHMKRTTMELGGHAPVIITKDANLEKAASQMAAAKFRNAGQVCIAPTRFLVDEAVGDDFVDLMSSKANALKVGNGLEPGVQMGPLIHQRRLDAVERLVGDALGHGAKIVAGGHRIDGEGTFYEPTVLMGMTPRMAAMNEEPFGPLALIATFSSIDQAIAEANRLPFGLGSYVYTRSEEIARLLFDRLKVGMMSINHVGLGLAETPYGGVRDSGYGYEGGTEALDGYLNTRFASHFVE